MYLRLINICFISSFLAGLTLQASIPTSNYYTGAVVEYHPVENNSENDTIWNSDVEENLNNYMKFIKTASKNDVDIIVFPENSLFTDTHHLYKRYLYLFRSTYLPDPQTLIVPCNNTASNVSEIVKKISCAANHHALYHVLNIREKEKCTAVSCSEDGHNFYNTNVVFDRNGALIARYRKWNLYGEISLGINRTSEPQLSTFRTDFGVNFGQFICFDLIFDTPSIRLIRDKKITDIVYSAHWFSQIPFLTANQAQAGWSYQNDVNFLGSGYNSPATGSGGSGIYAGKDGKLAQFWSEKPANAILIAKISKLINDRRMRSNNPNDFKVIIYSSSEIPYTDSHSSTVHQQKLKADDLSSYTSVLYQPKNGTSSLKLCNNDFCCNFTTETLHSNFDKNSVKYYRHRFAVFSGIKITPLVGTRGAKICGLVSCLDDYLTSCNQRFDIDTTVVNPITFQSIVISSVFKNTTDFAYFPSSINTKLEPLNVTDFLFTRSTFNKTHVGLKFILTNPRNDLMTFGIYGRDFSKDSLLVNSGPEFDRKFL